MGETIIGKPDLPNLIIEGPSRPPPPPPIVINVHIFSVDAYYMKNGLLKIPVANVSLCDEVFLL